MEICIQISFSPEMENQKIELNWIEWSLSYFLYLSYFPVIRLYIFSLEHIVSVFLMRKYTFQLFKYQLIACVHWAQHRAKWYSHWNGWRDVCLFLSLCRRNEPLQMGAKALSFESSSSSGIRAHFWTVKSRCLTFVALTPASMKQFTFYWCCVKCFLRLIFTQEGAINALSHN